MGVNGMLTIEPMVSWGKPEGQASLKSEEKAYVTAYRDTVDHSGV
jgi:hypothetical protein